MSKRVINTEAIPAAIGPFSEAIVANGFVYTAGQIPINVYREGNRIMVSTPVPGMEPSNIHIRVDGRMITIHSAQRGPGQQRTGHYLQETWAAGPYHGVTTLPAWVNVKKANATYDNGVLVIIFPEARIPTSGTVTMEKIGTSKGQVVGHVGKDLHSP